MIPQVSAPLKVELDRLLSHYFLEGGYPEVWTIQSLEAKQYYLFDNQVKKVIYEDLVLATDFRKPEMLKRFYISLLENPGKEISLNTFANETEINLQQIQKYLPLLEMTDLVHSLPKFRSQVLRIRKGLSKYYISDLALRNAVMRLNDSLLENNELMGLYAENLVFLTLKKIKSILQIDYFREKDYEVDFVVHTINGKFLPIEVKYRNKIEKKFLSGIDYFMQKHDTTGFGIVVTKHWSDCGIIYGNVAIPLPLYLVIMG
jgi:predicted AAA+ superfamily ATPase